MDNKPLSNTEQQPKIYTIIVTYNGMQWIDRCLASLFASNLKTHIIVIDNLSIDGTAEYIENNFTSVELIRSAENLGFGKGNNVGLRKTLNEEAHYAFLLNQDAWVQHDTLEKLVQAQQNNTDYGILSPVHLNAANTALETKFAEYAGPDNTPNLLSDLYFGKLKEVYSTQFVNAAAWLISNDCLKKVGGFDPIFPHYCEDVDYINRCKYHGMKVGIVATACATHDTKKYSWSDIKYNKQLRLNFIVLELKNINSSYRSAILVFIKKSMDEITSNLIFRKFKDLKLNISLLFSAITKIRAIKTTRKHTIGQQAYL